MGCCLLLFWCYGSRGYIYIYIYRVKHGFQILVGQVLMAKWISPEAVCLWIVFFFFYFGHSGSCNPLHFCVRGLATVGTRCGLSLQQWTDQGTWATNSLFYSKKNKLQKHLCTLDLLHYHSIIRKFTLTFN